MSISKKLSIAFAATLLLSVHVGAAAADNVKPVQSKRGWQANAQLIHVPPAARSNPIGARNALSLCDQCPPMIVLGIGF